MLVADQVVGVAAVPLNVTVLAPRVAPKLVPVIVTAVPTGPLVGARLVSVGAVVTVYVSALLARPPTVTTTLPVVAPVGTGTAMLVADQVVGVAAVPLNVTVLVPRVAPKLVPVIVTEVPTGPLVGDRLVSVGAAVTVYVSALLARPPTVTTTLPVVAPVGTGTAMLVADQVVGVAAVPLNVTVLLPCVDPKFAPVIVTAVPAGPLVGVRLVNVGATGTVYVSALLARPPTVTTTEPVVAPVGTGTAIFVGDQLVGVAAVPLNLTVLVPCVAPKFVPVIVTAVPTGPVVGVRLVNVGATGTVYVSALLARPPTVTMTLPVVAPVGTGTAMLVADQLVGVAAVPLNFTVLVPWVAPKFVPVIVTAVPTGPLVGDRLVRLGAVTVYVSALLARPPTVTTTLPVVAPIGTGTAMVVADQLVGVAAVPLNFTVLLPWVAAKFVPVIVTAVPTGPLVGDRLVRLGAVTV
jgi:mannitol/fructose-specific phosphotransferase system IIA component